MTASSGSDIDAGSKTDEGWRGNGSAVGRLVVDATSFLARRLAFGVVVLLTITYLSHFGLNMARGTPLHQALAEAAPKTLESILRVVSGDLGLSPSASSDLNPLPVAEVVPSMLSKSLGLLGTAIAFASLVGVGLGIWAAGRRHSNWSLVTLFFSIAGVSLPSFFVALLLQLGAIAISRSLGRPLIPVGGFGWDAHIILPALVLAARPIAQITRMTFISIGEVLDQDYVRTAHSKGLLPSQVLSRHVLRNAAIPVLTTIGVSLRFSLSSLPVVEFFFGWPGLGFSLLKSIAQQDDDLTVALVLSLGTLFILVNLAIDLAYRMLDPRLRDPGSRVEWRERERPLEQVRILVESVKAVVVNSRLAGWLRRERRTLSVSPFTQVLAERGEALQEDVPGAKARARRAWLSGTLGNQPFVLGTILVVGLMVVVFSGRRLAPQSPYATVGLTIVDGEITVPPFEPSESFPWGSDALGRDIMSLILTGAWQTIRLAGAVVLARLAIGFLLGAVAGWRSGGWIDRTLMGLAETLSAFPALLLSMTLILAIGIRRGFMPFIVALCFVGWGEVMQYVRGEVMAMRPRTFIEAAVSVGLRTPRIIMKHVLPNLLPALISITALEMGAVLMLLGELGFVGIFIGGGAFADLDVAQPPYHYSDVPEWGALLSNMRLYARSYPWTAIYPALAFFLAILGFNVFAEGVRRMVEEVGVRVTRLVNRYTIALAVAAILVLSWFQGSAGAMAVYRGQAREFDGQRALANVEALASADMEGRSLGTQGLDKAADWIAAQFEALGLQPAGEEFTYFQTRPRGFESLDAVPVFQIEDGGPPLQYHRDYSEFPALDRVLGEGRGPVRVVLMSELAVLPSFGIIPALRDVAYPDEILLTLSGYGAYVLSDVPAAGLVVVSDNPVLLGQKRTLSGTSPLASLFGTGRPIGHDRPILYVSPATADRLLSGTGHTVETLRRMEEQLVPDALVDIPTGVEVAMGIQGTLHEGHDVRNVIGHLPGTAGVVGHQMDDRLIVLLAQYDSPPVNPDGLPYAAANDNASGVAVMLEAIRAMQESGYQPYRSFLFVAYSGEGLEGGEDVSPPEVGKLLQTKFGFSERYEVEAVIELRGLGHGEGERLAVAGGGSLRLADLLDEAAGRMGVPVKRVGDWLDLSVVFEAGSILDRGEEAPRVGLSWDGWMASSRLPVDTLASISPEKLEKSGEALTLAMMILGREIEY